MWSSKNAVLRVFEWNPAENAAALSVLADSSVDLDNSTAEENAATAREGLLLVLTRGFVVLCWRL